MLNYASHVSAKVTPATERAKPNQIQSESKGYVFAVDDWKRLTRFLVLGSEGGSFYTSERKLTRENAQCVERCLIQDGLATVEEIVRISHEGRAPKNDAAIFALALACCAESIQTRKYAFEAIPSVCRIGTHLFQFVQNVKELRSFGHGLRNGIATWYSSRDADDLAFQICKYAQRNGMSHRDVLRLVHPKAPSAEHDAIYRYIVCGSNGGGERVVNNKKTGKVSEYEPVGKLPEFLHRFEELKSADEKRTIELITNHGFTHEMIQTQHKNSPAVWEALLQKMPLHAMIRNLNKMTAIGLIKPLSQAQKLVVSRLSDEEKIHKSRLHPLTILGAMRQYSKGHGDKGSLFWVPVPTVNAALEGAFYKSFDSVVPCNKNFFLGLDVSGSMSSEIPGTGMSSCEVVACLAMVTARKEPNYHMFGFCDKFVNLGIDASMNLAQVTRKVQKNNFGSTNISLPMVYALKEKLDVDCFCIYTDNDLNTGSIQPFQALKQYRNQMDKPNAKMIVMATCANNFTVADPSDVGSLDICGFSNDVPAVISAFVAE